MLIWMPLTSAYHWQVGMSGAILGGINIPLTVTKHAIFDTGTSLTYIPTAEYEIIIAKLIENRNCYI